jgi:uncharacterized protein YhhL (DUF1145 family)
VSLTLVFTSFAALIILNYVYPLPYRANLNIDVIRISVTILTAILLLISIWHFYSINITAEEKLLEEKKMPMRPTGQKAPSWPT